MINEPPSGFSTSYKASDGRESGEITLKDGILPSSETERQDTDDSGRTADKTQRAAEPPLPFAGCCPVTYE
jgi:hypothetical protein